MPPANSPTWTRATSPSDPTRSSTSPPTPPHRRRRRSTPRPPPRPLTPPLDYLSSPVPDLAATLHTSAEEEADEANVSFLRDSLESLDQAAEEHRRAIRRATSHIDSSRDPRRSNPHHPQPAESRSGTTAQTSASAESPDDLSRRERLQRVLARLNRIHDPAAPSSAAYSNRGPSPTLQSLYDWAPSQEDRGQEENELDQILAELRRHPPDTHPDVLRILSQSTLDSTRQRDRDTHASVTAEVTDAAERRDRLRERRRRESEWSLRSRAVMQRARQGSSPSATERMLRYVMERERSGMSEEEERARGAGWFGSGSGSGAGASERQPGSEQHRNGGSSREPWPLPPSAGELRRGTLQERADAMQRTYLAENVAPPRVPRISTPPVPTTSTSQSSSQMLESALKYLNQLRSCFQYQEALSASLDHGLATKEFFAEKHDDFILDLDEVDSIAASSWLLPGTIFEGHQHASNGSAGLLRSTPSLSSQHSVEQINPNFGNRATTTGFDHPPGSTRVQPFDATRPWLSHQFTLPILSPTSALGTKASESAYDQWPVRVILHSVDTDKMTIQGTMEAYDVPQHAASVSILNSSDRPRAGKKTAPITTFLEGHIIDLSTHSFLTPSAAEGKHSGPHATSADNATPYTSFTDGITFPAANAHTDAANWRKLPPFNTLGSDEDSARVLLSRQSMNEMHQEYIFMRWKEKCFVHSKDDQCSDRDRISDQDRGHGLTISGFYYVSLRRCDGQVEGLYFDPKSTPYQCLRLKGESGGWPAVEFR